MCRSAPPVARPPSDRHGRRRPLGAAPPADRAERIKSGFLPAVRFGRRLRINRSNLGAQSWTSAPRGRHSRRWPSSSGCGTPGWAAWLRGSPAGGSRGNFDESSSPGIGMVVLLLTGCGSTTTITQTTTVAQSTRPHPDHGRHPRARPRPRRALQRRSPERQLWPGHRSGRVPGTQVTVGPDTSCGFAANVAEVVGAAPR